MALVVNTNISSLAAQRNLSVNQASLAKSVEHLSSGLRITRASDDAADADANNLVTLGELFRFVRLRVRVETQFNQNPRMLIGTNEILLGTAVETDLALGVTT